MRLLTALRILTDLTRRVSGDFAHLAPLNALAAWRACA